MTLDLLVILLEIDLIHNFTLFWHCLCLHRCSQCYFL